LSGNNHKPMKVFTYPEPVLREKARAVENIDEEIQALIDRMAVTMYAAPGIGLAANQVGEPVRIIVFDLSPREEGPNLCVLINPEIVQAEGKATQEESCLSVIDFSAEITRPAYVKVTGVDRHGRPVEIDAEGLLSVCLQHEIDHLNGVLFIDHVSSLKRALYNKKLKKMLKRGMSQDK